jgi:histidine triad (HIT) family protein
LEFTGLYPQILLKNPIFHMFPCALKKLVHACRRGMMNTSGCIFCQVAAHEKPARILFEDEQCVAFQDINPKAPVHLLVIPRKHITSLNDNLEGDKALLGHLLSIVGRMAKEQGIDGTGYRAVINTNAEAGQTVFHLHIHVLGGRIFRWPPG